MIFKPTIDYARLLDTGRMSHQDLAEYYGRPPTRSELKWALADAKSKHPSKAPLIRSSAATGLYLMEQAAASAHHSTRIRQSIGAMSTAIDYHEKCPTGQLDAEQLKRHDSIGRCARTLRTELTKAVKALPWEK